MINLFRAKSWISSWGSLLFAELLSKSCISRGAWLMRGPAAFGAVVAARPGDRACALLAQLVVVAALLLWLAVASDGSVRAPQRRAPCSPLPLVVWRSISGSRRRCRGLLIVLLWAIHPLISLGQPNFRRAYGIGRTTHERG